MGYITVLSSKFFCESEIVKIFPTETYFGWENRAS
jgi:hypothetical protein